MGRTAVQTGVSTGVSASKGMDPRELFLQAGANIGASAVACAVADKIGSWYRGGDIDSVLHKVLHAGSGFLQGMASNLDDPIGGGVGGAFAGLAEVVYEILPDSLDKDVRANIAIASAATAALFTNQDVNAAALTATNAVYHNSQGGEDDKRREEASQWQVSDDSLDDKPVIHDEKALLAGVEVVHGFMYPEISLLSEINQAAHGIVHKTFQEIKKSPNLTQGLKCVWDGALLGMFGPHIHVNRALPESYRFLPTPRGTANALVDMAIPTNGYGLGFTASMFVTGGTTRAARSIGQGIRSGASRVWTTVQEMRVVQSRSTLSAMDLFQAQTLRIAPVNSIPNKKLVVTNTTSTTSTVIEDVEKTVGKRTASGFGVTEHGVSRKIERRIRSIDELEALKNPLKVKDVKFDSYGRPSQRYIGKKAEVVINPETKEIISVNPTSTNKRNKFIKNGENK